MSQEKKKIPAEDLEKVLGGVKSSILSEIDAERQSVVAYHTKYEVDRYTKDTSGTHEIN